MAETIKHWRSFGVLDTSMAGVIALLSGIGMWSNASDRQGRYHSTLRSITANSREILR